MNIYPIKSVFHFHIPQVCVSVCIYDKIYGSYIQKDRTIRWGQKMNKCFNFLNKSQFNRSVSVQTCETFIN